MAWRGMACIWSEGQATKESQAVKEGPATKKGPSSCHKRYILPPRRVRPPRRIRPPRRVHQRPLSARRVHPRPSSATREGPSGCREKFIRGRQGGSRVQALSRKPLSCLSIRWSKGGLPARRVHPRPHLQPRQPRHQQQCQLVNCVLACHFLLITCVVNKVIFDSIRQVNKVHIIHQRLALMCG